MRAYMERIARAVQRPSTRVPRGAGPRRARSTFVAPPIAALGAAFTL